MLGKMETLGSILLHEYNHYTNLVAPSLSKQTDDPAYEVSRHVSIIRAWVPIVPIATLGLRST